MCLSMKSVSHNRAFQRNAHEQVEEQWIWNEVRSKSILDQQEITEEKAWSYATKWSYSWFKDRLCLECMSFGFSSLINELYLYTTEGLGDKEFVCSEEWPWDRNGRFDHKFVFNEWMVEGTDDS